MNSSVAIKEVSGGPNSAVAGWLSIGLVTGLVVALYAEIFADLAMEWWNVPSSSYGMLIPPLAGYIVYMNRRTLLAVPAHPDLGGLGLTALGCFLLVGGHLAAEFFLARLSMVLLAAGLVWTFWGAERFRLLLFPFVLLCSMVPLPAIVYNAVAVPLQLFASEAATYAAQAVGVSIYRQGNIIQLANTSLGVAEACSGLQSLSALLVASLLVGFLENGTILGRTLLFFLAAPLAIAVNVLRITGTAILADYRLEFALGFYHSFSGWLVFILGFGGLWLLGKAIFRLTGRRA
jgi:exosortase